MKMIISFLLTNMLLIQATFGMTSSQQKLTNAFEELNYSLSVEWDQKDLAVKAKIVSEFRNNIAQLKKDGASNEDLLLALKSSVLNKKGAKELDALVNTIETQNLSDDELYKVINDFAAQSNKTGSQFSSGATAAVIIGVAAIIAAVVLVVILTNNTEPGPGPDPDPQPQTPVSYTCTSYNNLGFYWWYTSISQAGAANGAFNLCVYNTAYYNVCYTPTCVANY